MGMPRVALSLLCATVTLLAVGPSGALAHTDQYGKWHSPTTETWTLEDFPQGSRWEPARVCHQGSPEFIYPGSSATSTDEYYTAAGWGHPNGHQHWDVVNFYNNTIAPMITEFMSKRLLVVRTGDPIDTSVVSHFNDEFHAHYRKNITDCDLLVVWRFVKDLGAAGKAAGGGHDKYGRVVLCNIKLDVQAMSGFVNSYYETCAGKAADDYCPASHVGTLGAFSAIVSTTIHEMWHGLRGTTMTTAGNKDPTFSINQGGDGNAPWFQENVINKRPTHWPEATYVRNFYTDMPVKYDPATSHFGRQSIYFQNTPRVLEHTRHWFNCPTLSGFAYGQDMKEKPPARYYYGHQHNVFGTWCDNFAYGGKGCTSAMSWAVLEDLGKWKVNWTNVNFQNVNEDLFGGSLPTNDPLGQGTGIPNYQQHPFNDQLQHDIFKETWKRGCGYFDEPWPWPQDETTDPGDVSPINGLTYHNPHGGYSGIFCNGASWNGDLTKRDYCSIDGASKYVCMPHGHRGNGPCASGPCSGVMQGEADGIRNAMIQPKTHNFGRIPGETDDDGTTTGAVNITNTKLPGSCQYAGSQNQERYGESAVADSRCFRGSIEPTGEAKRAFTYETAFCFQKRCDANNLVEIEIKGAWYLCPELGGKLTVAGFSGHVTCPHQAIYCPANCPKSDAGVECFGRGTCNRGTGVCDCRETLVNASFVGIGCDVPWQQFWPSTYDGGYGQFTQVALTLALPKWDDYGDSKANARAAVYAALGVDPGTTTIEISKITHDVSSVHFYEGASVETWNALGGAVGPEEWFAGQVAGITGGVTKWYDVNVTAAAVGFPARRRKMLASSAGLQVTYTIPFDEMAPARAAANANASPATFATKTASSLGALTITRAPAVATTISIQIGTDDATAAGLIGTRSSNRTAFHAAVTSEMDNRGMFTPESDGEGLFFGFGVLGIAISGAVGVGVLLGVVVGVISLNKRNKNRNRVAPEGAVKKTLVDRGKAAPKKIAPKK